MTSNNILPATFVQLMVNMHGAVGQTWCDNLPQHLISLSTLWQVDIGEAFPLSYNYVCRATRRHDGLPVVIKTCPKSNEFPSELQMLRHYAGRGAVPLLAADESRYAMLLAYVAPGTTLHAGIHDDDTATIIAAQLMRQSITPAPVVHTMPHSNDWAKGFTKLQTLLGPDCGPFMSADVTWAQQIFYELGNGATPYALHGDLHHDNIIQHGNDWVIIDPHGVVCGDKAFECGAFLRNPHDLLHNHHDIVGFTQRRIALMSEILVVPASHIALWNFAQMVLSAWWCYEDSGAVDADAMALIAPFPAVAQTYG